MKRVFRWAAGIVVVLAACLGALLLAKDSLLRRLAEWRIEEKTGLEAHIGELKAPLGTGTLAIRDFRLMNPPGFGTNVLLNIPELYVQLDPGEAASGRLHFRELRFHLEELNVVRDANDRLNLSVFEDNLGEHVQTNSPGASDSTGTGLAFGGIDRLQLTLGRVRFIDLAHPRKNRLLPLNVQNETATNLRTEADLTNWVASFVFRLVMQEIFGREDEPSGQREIISAGPGPNRSSQSVTPAP